MPKLDVVVEQDECDIVVAPPPMPVRYRSSDELGLKPPLPVRRHSVAQTDHKHLHEEAPLFFNKLKSIFDERPDSPARDGSASSAEDINSLEKQTLQALFSSAVSAAPTKHPLSYDLHASHQLDLHDQLFRSSKLPKVEAPASEPDAPSSASKSLAGPRQWIEALRERKVAPDSTSSSSDTPPEGWRPTITTMRAVLKLRKLMQRGKANADKAVEGRAPASYAAAAAAPAAKAEALVAAASSSHASTGDEELAFQQLADPEFDYNAFMEECWVAQSATILDDGRSFNEAILCGAYDEPMHAAAAPSPAAAYHYNHMAAAAAAAGQQVPPFSPRSTMAPMAPFAAPPAMPPPAAMAPPAAMMVPTPAMMVASPVMASPIVYSEYAPNAAAPQMWPSPMPSPAPSPMVGGHWASGWSVAHAPSVGAPPMMAPAMEAHHQHHQQHQQHQHHQHHQHHHASMMAVSPHQGAPALMAQPPPPPLPATTPSGVPHGALAGMAVEQEGSKTLQQLMWAMPPNELAVALDELAPHLPYLVTHPFGNYLVSTIAYLPAAHHAVYHSLAGRLVQLMQHPQGSRVCQAAFERLAPDVAFRLVAELEGRVHEVSCSTHGSWSVVCAHRHTGAPFILSELSVAIPTLATQQNGSRVVQRVLTEASERGEDVAAPLEALAALGPARLTALAQDRFGNYVVQIALKATGQVAGGRAGTALLGMLLPAIAELSSEKCGSNVAEVLVELASPAQLAEVRKALGEAFGADALRSHAYASYVLSAVEAKGAQ